MTNNKIYYKSKLHLYCINIIKDRIAAIAAAIAGEATGLIQAIEPAAVILDRMIAEAEALLARGAGLAR